MVLAQPQPRQQGQLFGQERQLIKQKQNNLLLMQSALSAVAIAGLAMPVLDPSESTQMKTFSFFAGMASAAALFAVSSSAHAKQLDKLAEAMEGGEKEALKTHMGVRLAHAQQLAAMNGRRQLVEQIMMTTYPHEWLSHAQRAGVADLLPPPPAPPQPEPMPETIEVKSRAKTLAELEAINKGDYDMSWFNMGFLFYPAAIAGAPGTGKSFTIRYRTAELLRMYPNSTVIVLDDHNKPRWEDFIEGIEVVKDDPKRAWNVVCLLEKELKRRKREGKDYDWSNRETPLFRVVWEEFQDGLQELTPSQQKKALELISSVNGRQGRKYGVGFDLCYHDFSVEGSGLKQQVLMGMGWLLLGDTIDNANLRLPKNFEIDTIIKDRMLEAGTLVAKEARAHIFKRASGDDSASDGFKPKVVVFPKREIPKIVINREPLTIDVEAQTTELSAFKPMDKIPSEQYEYYDSYIGSSDWQNKRIAVLARDSDKCRCCSATDNLQVHHLTYTNLGNERLEDLVTLCETCHREVHRL